MIECKQAEPTKWTEHYSNIYSQYGEDGIIAEIFRRIGTTNKQCFEVGAADGRWFSNSRQWIDAGWRACLIEADEKNWPELNKLDGDKVTVVQGKAEPSGPNSLDSIMAQCNFEQHPDLGVIDVDGQDYYLWNGMLKFQPRVMVIEYDRFANENFVPELNGAGQAGIQALCSVAASKGYFSVATTKTNMIFVLNSEREKMFADGSDKPTSSELEDKQKAEAAKTDPNELVERLLIGLHECRNNNLFDHLGAAGQQWEDDFTKAIADAEKYAVQHRSGLGAIARSANGNGNSHKPQPAPPERMQVMGLESVAKPIPTIETAKHQEIKICAVLSRPRFGLNIFWDCANETLSPWGIPIQSFYGVFWGQMMEKAMEDNVDLDWILTLDYDTLSTSKHMQSMIDMFSQNPKIDALAALQCRRGRPLPLAVRADGQMQMTGRPVQVTTAHFGFTLFRTEAIKRMRKKPWFWAKPAANGGWGDGRLDDDIYFWGQWRDAGNSLYMHTGCCVGHVEEMVTEFTPDGKQRHIYLSEWRKNNGHTIKNFE